MAQISWGKPYILVADLDAAPFKWIECPTPADGTTTLETTQGDKTEAKLEGGANEDVKTNANTYAFNYSVRKVKNRKKHIEDSDGIIKHNYAVLLQPEDPSCSGILIQLSSVAVQDSYTAADGIMLAYTHNALAPKSGNQIKYGIVDITKSGDSISSVKFTPEEDAEQGYDGETQYNITNTAELTTEV